MELILASASPRRKALLKLAGFEFRSIPSHADETNPKLLPTAELVVELARRKADEIATLHPEAVVLGCDTIVAIGGKSLGKPGSEEVAKRMLRRLSGRTHAVYTGCALRLGAREHLFCETTFVTFYPLTEGEIDAYVKSGEPYDKAGAYGIQGAGALLVRRIAGDYYNVMGLPIARLVREMRHFL